MSEQNKMSDDQAEDFGGPLARHSEFKPGEQVQYLAGGNLLRSGEVLHVLNGYGGGQCYIVENTTQGFPDVVFAREIFLAPIFRGRQR